MSSELRPVTIDGREYMIGQLCWDQLRVVMPLVLELEEPAMKALRTGILRLSTEQYDKMLQVIYHGLKFDNPDITFEDLLKSRTPPQEMFLVYVVVRYQTGAFVAGGSEDSTNDPETRPVGEAVGEAK